MFPSKKRESTRCAAPSVPSPPMPLGAEGVGEEGLASGCICVFFLPRFLSSSLADLISFLSSLDVVSAPLCIDRVGPVPYLRGFCFVHKSKGERGKRTCVCFDNTKIICRPRIKRRTSRLCPRTRWCQPPSRKGWSEGRGMSEPAWRRAHLPASSWHEVAAPPARSSLPLGVGSVWVLRGHDARWIWRMCWRSKTKRRR